MVELNAGALSAQIIAARSEACMLNPYNQGDIESNPVVHFKEMLPNKIKCFLFFNMGQSANYN